MALIDGDSGFTTVFARRAEDRGWDVRRELKPIPAERLVSMKLDALLLDPDLLGDGAWGYLAEIRGRLSGLGLLVCTSPTSLDSRVRGLRMGVDDWITKPFHPEEALARVESVSRHASPRAAQADAATLRFGALEIHPDQYDGFLNGVGLGLTAREFTVLLLLARSPGTVLEREVIYQRVWGYAMAHGDRSVDVFIRKLRAKLERRAPGHAYIHTHFGIGYRFQPPPIQLATGDSAVAVGDEPNPRQTFGSHRIAHLSDSRP